MRRSSFRVIFGTDASSDPRRLKFEQTKRLKATTRYGYGEKYMIQDSHVVALHISLRCVEVAATMCGSSHAYVQAPQATCVS
jgi:hypothetical protein